MMYEVMILLDPKLTDLQRKEEMDGIASAIEQHQGKVLKLVDQGRRKLAYPVKKSYEGYSLLYYVEGLGDMVKNLSRLFKIKEQILRFMISQSEDVLEKTS
ncbi:30S ribosomal protein S6 [PVC group bacterium]|nr:30S ribosomal protein S6 [PVC group bacterium]